MKLFRAIVNWLLVLLIPPIGALILLNEYAITDTEDELKEGLRDFLNGDRFLWE